MAEKPDLEKRSKLVMLLQVLLYRAEQGELIGFAATSHFDDGASGVAITGELTQANLAHLSILQHRVAQRLVEQS